MIKYWEYIMRELEDDGHCPQMLNLEMDAMADDPLGCPTFGVKVVFLTFENFQFDEKSIC